MSTNRLTRCFAVSTPTVDLPAPGMPISVIEDLIDGTLQCWHEVMGWGNAHQFQSETFPSPALLGSVNLCGRNAELNVLGDVARVTSQCLVGLEHDADSWLEHAAPCPRQH